MLVAVKPEISMEDAKEVHTSLRKAAGLIKFVQVCTGVYIQKPISTLSKKSIVPPKFVKGFSSAFSTNLGSKWIKYAIFFWFGIRRNNKD